MKLLKKNKKAEFNFELFETFICGIVLVGSEIYPVKQSNVNFVDSYITIDNNELFLVNLNICKHPTAFENHIENRKRKLLMRKRDIFKLKEKIFEKRFLIIPLEILCDRNKIKVKIALAKGKKLFDKKKSQKEKDIGREMDREILNQKEFS